MKQFGSPKEALWWWWEMTEIGIPLRFFRQDLSRPCVQMSRQVPLVSDLWCTWVTLDMMFERMPDNYQEVVHRYFKTGRFVRPFSDGPALACSMPLAVTTGIICPRSSSGHRGQGALFG